MLRAIIISILLLCLAFSLSLIKATTCFGAGNTECSSFQNGLLFGVIALIAGTGLYIRAKTPSVEHKWIKNRVFVSILASTLVLVGVLALMVLFGVNRY